MLWILFERGDMCAVLRRARCVLPPSGACCPSPSRHRRRCHRWAAPGVLHRRGQPAPLCPGASPRGSPADQLRPAPRSAVGGGPAGLSWAVGIPAAGGPGGGCGGQGFTESEPLSLIWWSSTGWSSMVLVECRHTLHMYMYMGMCIFIYMYISICT